MAFNSKRIRWIAILVLSALVAIAALVWFVVAPAVIENYASEALGKVQEKTGRHIKLGDIRLTGLKSAHVAKITVSDVHAPEKIGVHLENVSIALTGLPINDQFSIASIDVGGLDIQVRVQDGVTNFDDIIQKLMPKEAEAAEKPKKPSAWKKFITPLPALTVDRVQVSMPSIRVNDILEVGAVSASQLSWTPSLAVSEFYELEGKISALLNESGKKTTYHADLFGNIKNAKEGVISVSLPLSDSGLTPELMRHAKGDVVFRTASLVLPTTFEVADLRVLEGDKALVHAERARARLMTLPPKKVSGVYFKEVELVRPTIHDYMRDDGSALYNFGIYTLDSLSRGMVSSIQDSVKEAAVEMATDAAKTAIEAGIKAAAVGSKDIMGDITRSVVEEVVEKKIKEKTIKNYFFSQRMFITDGKVVVEDLRDKPWMNFSIEHIQFEVGYRSIRKAVDYLISLQAVDPIYTKVELNGVYEMASEHVTGELLVHPMRSTDNLRKTQENLTSVDVEKFDKAAELLKFLPSFNMDKAILEGSFKYDVRLKTQDARLTTRFEVKDLMVSHDALSPEPILLNGSVGFSLASNWKTKQFKFENVEILTGGTSFKLGMMLNKGERKTRARTNVPSKTVEDWKFDIRMELPQQPVQQLFQATPHAFRMELDGLTWQGAIGLAFEATGFLGAIGETKHKFELTRSEDFGVLTWPMGRDLMALNHGMTHTVVDPNALIPHEIVIPPSIYPITINELPVYEPTVTLEEIRALYPHWVFFDDLNPWLVQLITTTEDGSFFTHEGFSSLQIKAALQKNISQQAFSRGASTISMQLIKNLFFERTKTISRKAQEVLYTWLMESVVQIPKQRIMEMYFNIIEFGPEIYGIEEAAKYYFGKRSQDLSLKECAFLMAIIPNPRKGAIYRVQPTLDRSIQKTMDFYIQEMYRRKCEPEVLEKMREKFAKLNKPVPFEPCCPPKESIDQMLSTETLAFYLPDPKDTLQYAYLPDLYLPDGTPTFERRQTTCGYRGGELGSAFDDEGLIEPMDSIFEPFIQSEMDGKSLELELENPLRLRRAEK